MKRILIIVGLLLIAAMAFSQAPRVGMLDGNYWYSLDVNEKTEFVRGFFTALHLSNMLVYGVDVEGHDLLTTEQLWIIAGAIDAAYESPSTRSLPLYKTIILAWTTMRIFAGA